MVKVEVNQNKNRIASIHISGHAYSADPGFDLVCAAVSSIGVGTLNALDELAHDDYDLVLIESDDPVIEIKEKNSNSVGNIVLETMLIQLKTLQESHPEHITIHTRR